VDSKGKQFTPLSLDDTIRYANSLTDLEIEELRYAGEEDLLTAIVNRFTIAEQYAGD
jgi:hypothetical protein